MGEWKIEKAQTEEAVALVAHLAEEIWHQHFTPIIGREQVMYMLEKFQSFRAIIKQIVQQGYQYYLLLCSGQAVGYFAIHPEEEKLFLSKIYIKQEFRGRGLSRRAVEFMAAFCKAYGLRSIYLTVNRGNEGSIAAYRAMGFQTVRRQKTDIGSGFVMDDYVMEKPV